jgi:hypothetical protein
MQEGGMLLLACQLICHGNEFSNVRTRDSKFDLEDAEPLFGLRTSHQVFEPD